MRIIWYSKIKRLKDSQLDLREITDIRMGQTTSNFARHPTPKLARVSFSLMYRGGSAQNPKSLDLVAKDPNEFSIWIAGIQVACHTNFTRGQR